MVWPPQSLDLHLIKNLCNESLLLLDYFQVHAH
jgi:hypothetical protein